MFKIKSLDKNCEESIQQRIDQKTKPLASLGQLEDLAKQMALIQSSEKITINKPTMLVFAGDHGIANEGVSIASSEVTQQMVLNFLNGGGAINCFCRNNDMELKVIDAGILLPIDDKRLIQQSLGKGTQNFSKQAAMKMSQVNKGIKLGAQVVYSQVDSGSNIIGFGEMGIANTTSAAAIMAAILELPINDCVGRGTGIDDATLNIKSSLLLVAFKLHNEQLKKPLDILANVGGFEIVQMVGGMLAAAEKNCIILVDGFIATAAALVANLLNENVLEYMVFCHQSKEKGHQLMLRHLKAKPLLDLGLCLGEGTGAALALPLLHCATSFYNDMASMDSAGISVGTT